MRIICTIGLLILALGVAANAQVLINDGLTTAPGAWTKVGSGPNARVDDDRGATDGYDWAIGGSDGTGASAPHDFYYSQSFLLAPGLYDITASGWCKAWAGWWGSENWEWVQEAIIEVLVDGAIVASQRAYNDVEGTEAYWNTWLEFDYTGQEFINNNIEMRLHVIKDNNKWGQDNLGAIFFDSRFDDAYLEVNLVPEPASLLALLTGAAGMVGVFARRRK